MKLNKIVPGLFLPMLVLFSQCTVALLRDEGHVSEAAMKEASAAMNDYLRKVPDQSPAALAVVDYSRPSFLKRMVIVDLGTGQQSFYRVAHGKKSGELYAVRFSNTPESNMSSLGLYRVARSYSGDHGLARRLEGLDSLQNGNAAMRDIVVHSADYVSLPFILLNLVTFNGPRIGRSNGCFVVSRDDISAVERQLGQGGFIYAWKGPGRTRK